MSSYKPIGNANIRGVFAISVLLASSQAQALAPPCIGGDVGGQVFLELPVNGATSANTYGVKDTNELGLEGISVTVVDANGVQAPVITDENGAWTVKAPVLPVRVQFNWSESWLQNSANGSASNTSVQFVAASSCDANLGLHDPSTYSQANPDIALACYVNGTGVGNSDAGLVSTPYTSTGLNSTYFTYPGDNTGTQGTGPVPSSDATVDEVGSAWGAAWQANKSRLFLSTSLKRHIGMADGPGYVYVMDYSGVSASLARKFDLVGITPANGGAAISLGSVCREAACASDSGNTGNPVDYALPASKLDPSYDLDAFAKVGTMSFGDIDLQSDNNTLWLVNIFQNALISVDVKAASASLPLANSVNQYPLASMTGAPTCSGGVMRPWALSFFRGKGYLGAVCDGSTGSDNDIKAYVLSFDPNNMAAGVSVELDFALNYARDNNPNITFRAWLEDYDESKIIDPNGRTVYPQPILSDIEFDPAGNMYLNIMDRLGHQIGHGNYKPVSGSTKLITSLVTGDMLKACKTTGGFVLEDDTGCGTGEFFEDTSGDARPESANGAFLSLMGSNEMMSLVVDPHPTGTVGQPYWHTQGVNTYSLTDGLITNWYSVNFSDSIAFSGKGIGLGDIELLTDAAPVEIGNRVWNDTIKNGLQDAGESGIDGVSVVLTCGADNVTRTTANGGQYYFSNADNDSAFMGSGKSCIISIDMAQGALSGLDLATVDADNNQTNSPLTDVLDSDAVLNGGKAEITVIVGQVGENNHSLDFGFREPACVINTPTIVAFCENNGTLSNPADDVFRYTINASGTHTAITYNISGGDTQTGVPYGPLAAGLSFGPFLINSGNLSLTLTDVDDNSCQLSNVVVTAPATCSNDAPPVCSIDTPVINPSCDNNGTPSDPTDDLISYTIQVNGQNTGASYDISGGDTQTGLLYSDQASGPFPIGGGSQILTVTDISGNCPVVNTTFTAPNSCSDTAPLPVFDFGDAPGSYGTGSTSHKIVSGLQLGAALDKESAGQDSNAANGDGADEDGVIIPELIDGGSVTLNTTVTNTTGADANLVCWIDYNGDGQFATDGSESGSAIVANGSNNASVSVAMPPVLANSSSLTNGNTFVRCRLTTDPISQSDPTGLADDGEVEDYRVPVRAPAAVTPPSLATPIPTLSEWMLVLLSALIAMLGWQTRKPSRID